MRVPQKHAVRKSLTPRQKEEARLNEMLQRKSTASRQATSRAVAPRTQTTPPRREVTPRTQITPRAQVTPPRTVTRTATPRVTPRVPMLNINKVKAPSTPAAITPKPIQKRAVRTTVQSTSTQTQTLEVTPQIQPTLFPVNALVQKQEELKELYLLQSEVWSKIQETIEEIRDLKQTIPSDVEFQAVDLTAWDDLVIVEDTPIAEFKIFIEELEHATTFEKFEMPLVEPIIFSEEAEEFRAFAENLAKGFDSLKESLSLASSPLPEDASFSFPDENLWSFPDEPTSLSFLDEAEWLLIDEPTSSSLDATETQPSESNGCSSNEVVPTQDRPTVSLIALTKILKEAFPNESLTVQKLHSIYEEAKDMSIESLIAQIKGEDRS